MYSFFSKTRHLGVSTPLSVIYSKTHSPQSFKYLFIRLYHSIIFSVLKGNKSDVGGGEHLFTIFFSWQKDPVHLWGRWLYFSISHFLSSHNPIPSLRGQYINRKVLGAKKIADSEPALFVIVGLYTLSSSFGTVLVGRFPPLLIAFPELHRCTAGGTQ